MRNVIAAVAALCLLSCGGSQKGEEEPPPERDDASDDEPEPEPVMSEEERLLAAHQARQTEACEPMCARLTECVFARTEEHAPEQLEGVDVDALRRHYEETKCLSPCRASKLSVRQVETIERCNEAGGDCEEFLDCLDAVQPQGDGG